MAAGQLAALRLPPGFAVAYAVCFVLSVLYSVPPFRLKAVAGADWVINMWGFGTLTPYAGWAATGMPVDPARGLVLLAFCPLFAALYPLTQLYQLEEDVRRGDRTLASRARPRAESRRGARRRARWRSRCSPLAAFGRDGGCRPTAGAGVCSRGVRGGLGGGAGALAGAGRRDSTPAEHQRGMYRALARLGGDRRGGCAGWGTCATPWPADGAWV